MLCYNFTAIALIFFLNLEKLNHDVLLTMEYIMLSNTKVLFPSIHIILISFSYNNSIPLVKLQSSFIPEK